MFAALPLFHTNALLVTVLAPLLKGLHVVWAGPLGYRDPPSSGTSGGSSSATGSRRCPGSRPSTPRSRRSRSTRTSRACELPIVGAAPLPPAVPTRSARAPASRCARATASPRARAPARSTARTRARGDVSASACRTRRRAPSRSTRRPASGRSCRPARSARSSCKGPTSSPAISSGESGTELRADDKVRDGWLDTGDLGSVDDDGFIRLAGRAKDLIIRGGHNIDPADDRGRAARAPGGRGGRGGRPARRHAGEVPVAYVALAEGAGGDRRARGLGGRARPRAAAAPRRVEIIDEIPLTAVGKPFKPDPPPPPARVGSPAEAGAARIRTSAQRARPGKGAGATRRARFHR